MPYSQDILGQFISIDLTKSKERTRRGTQLTLYKYSQGGSENQQSLLSVVRTSKNRNQAALHLTALTANDEGAVTITGPGLSSFLKSFGVRGPSAQANTMTSTETPTASEGGTQGEGST